MWGAEKAKTCFPGEAYAGQRVACCMICQENAIQQDADVDPQEKSMKTQKKRGIKG